MYDLAHFRSISSFLVSPDLDLSILRPVAKMTLSVNINNNRSIIYQVVVIYINTFFPFSSSGLE
jgi:hypothetical protein